MQGSQSEQPEFEPRPLDPYLRETVRDLVLPPATPAPDVLPFDLRSPEDFERICVVIAEQVDGLRDVSLYGVPGQKQEGLDLVGFNATGEAVVYQARRWPAFSVRDLRQTVEGYALGRRPFGAKRFVICVSSSARRTEVLEELARLRGSYDFDIDIYDQVRLSEMLKQRGDIVRRLFGEEWERLFCLAERATPPARSPADLLADAILRGPLDALDLTAIASQAQEVLESNPSRAAELCGVVAEALEKSEFAGFAETFRQRQAAASVRAGDLSTAARLLVDVGWKHAQDTGLRISEVTRRMAELAAQPEAPATAGLLIGVFTAVDRWYADPYINLDEIASKVVALAHAGAPGSHQASLWLAESAVVSERSSLVRQLSETLTAVIAAREARTESDEIAVRLRACIADATGEWESLVYRALRGRLGRRQATLVHARHGRYLAWNGEPEAADKSYRLAIDQACQARLNSEAAAALHSIWTIGARYGLPLNEWSGAEGLARAVRPLGGDYLRSGYDRRAAALGALAADKLPDALRELRAHLWTSVVSGRLASEIDAHELLGELYSRTGELRLATNHYIRSGDARGVEQLLAGGGSYVDCAEQLARQAPWERATALAALASEGDLIPDDQVDALARVALKSTSGERQGPFMPSVSLSAYSLLAALGRRLPEDLCDLMLDLLEPQIGREANHYRHNDDQHVQIVAALFLAYPHRRGRTGRHLLALMAASPELGRQVLQHGWDAIQSGSDILHDDLHKLGDKGCQAALDALLYLERDHPLLTGQARRLLEKVLNPPPRPPGHYSYGTDLPRIAVFVVRLPQEDRLLFAEAAMRVAEDASEMEANRTDALRAEMIVARSLPDRMKTSLFDRSVLLAASPAFSELDQLLKAGSHPLSAFRFNLGFGSLVPMAIRAAATLAHTGDQYQQVVGAAAILFRAGDEFAANQAAHALAQVPPEVLTIDVRVLAGSRDRWARQLAVVLWTRDPDQAPTLGRELARDPDRAVRLVLAGSLKRLEGRIPDLVAELRELLSQDPSASVRAELK